MKKNAAKKEEVGTAAYVVAHAQRQKRRGRRPAMHFLGITNPNKAFTVASELLRLSQEKKTSNSGYYAFAQTVQQLFDRNDVVKMNKHLVFDERIIQYQPIYNLVERFEHDIQFGCNSLNIKFNHSSAWKELVRRGQKVLGPIVGYLKERTPPSGEFMEDDISIAWSMLLCNIKQSIDSQPIDLKFGNLAGWVSWAERFSTQPNP